MQFYLQGNRAVPMIIAKRYVTEEPKVTSRRRFVGFRQGLGTLAYKAIELIQECFWDEEQEVENPGEFKVINYAIDVVDDPGQGKPELIVTRLDGEATPGCGVYCHMIYPSEAPSEDVEDLHPYAPKGGDSGAKLVQPKRKRPGE
ncbi:MAG: hypothetical protein AB7L09_03150 [Nitrospira sp.]